MKINFSGEKAILRTLKSKCVRDEHSMWSEKEDIKLALGFLFCWTLIVPLAVQHSINSSNWKKSKVINQTLSIITELEARPYTVELLSWAEGRISHLLSTLDSSTHNQNNLNLVEVLKGIKGELARASGLETIRGGITVMTMLRKTALDSNIRREVVSFLQPSYSK